MKKQTHLIQFLPYFSPHIWGVEKVWEQIFLKWTHWKSFILSGNICQQPDVHKEIVDNKIIYFFPCIEIVDNFIFPSIWTKRFWKVWKEFSQEVQNSRESGDIKILTHTRFFLSSLMGWIFARRYTYSWIHLEHGSEYVKLSSPIKSKIAYFYDRLIGKWIYKKADGVLAISWASKKFIETHFWRKEVHVWYRGFDFPKPCIKQWEKHFVFIGRLVYLKW